MEMNTQGPSPRLSGQAPNQEELALPRHGLRFSSSAIAPTERARASTVMHVDAAPPPHVASCRVSLVAGSLERPQPLCIIDQQWVMKVSHTLGERHQSRDTRILQTCALDADDIRKLKLPVCAFDCICEWGQLGMFPWTRRYVTVRTRPGACVRAFYGFTASR